MTQVAEKGTRSPPSSTMQDRLSQVNNVSHSHRTFLFTTTLLLSVFMNLQFLIEGLFTGALGLFGVAGNAVSIRVLGSADLDMTPTFRHLLRMLAAFDATFLALTVSLFCVSAW